MLTDNADAYIELFSLQAGAGKLEAASSKVFVGNKSRILRMEELKETIKTTEEAKKDVAIIDYEWIKVFCNNHCISQLVRMYQHDI